MESKAKIIYTESAAFPYNAQIWTGGNYCGNGKYFKSLEEAQDYKRRIENGSGERKAADISGERIARPCTKCLNGTHRQYRTQ